jgi:hypothetical protein
MRIVVDDRYAPRNDSVIPDFDLVGGHQLAIADIAAIADGNSRLRPVEIETAMNNATRADADIPVHG